MHLSNPTPARDTQANTPPSRFGRPRPSPLQSSVAQHIEALHARALFLTRSKAEAADLTQDTLERGLRTPPGKVPPAKMRGWLLVIMHNLFLDHRRSHESRRRVALTDQMLANVPAPTPEAQPRWTDFSMEQVRELLPRLPAHLRVPVELSMAGRSYKAVAQALKITRPTVGTRIHRARRRLRLLLERTQAER